MSRTAGIVIVAFVFAFRLAAGVALADPAPRFVELSPCKNGDECSSQGADCSARISGCHDVRSCAYCSCGTAGCSCDCRGRVRDTDAGVASRDRVPNIFDSSLTEPWEIRYSGLTLRGFYELLEAGLPAGWTLRTTVDLVGPERQITGDFGFEGAPRQSVEQVIRQIAAGFGMCVEASDANKTIVFIDCKQGR